MAKATHVTTVGDPHPQRSDFLSFLDAGALRRAALAAVIMGSFPTLSNQPAALLGSEDSQLLPLILVYFTPLVVVAVSRGLGVRQAMLDTQPGKSDHRNRETFFEIAFSHRIPVRAVLVALVVGSVNSAIVMAVACLRHGNFSTVQLALVVRAFTLPSLFGVLSQAIAYRRVATALAPATH